MPGEVVVEANHLWKKFKRGEIFSSLRDLIPALVKRTVTREQAEKLQVREFWALKDVCFQVRRGEAFGIIGHNGAGKSTLLKHLSGIIQPTRGSLSVKGRLSALIEVGAGFHPDLTGRENIYLYGTILGMDREEIRRKFDAIVAFSELEDFIDTPVKRYSSGMFARLGFSVSAHVEPEVLIIDEVLSVGDYLFQRKGLEKMRQVMAGGATVLFVSHNLRAMTDLCQRAILMDHGQVLIEGTTAEVVRRYMDRSKEGPADTSAKEAYISRIKLYDDKGNDLQFEAGQEVTVEIDVTANQPCQRLAVVIECADDEQYDVFNTSTQRLGETPFNLEPGQTERVTFRLTLHLVPGTFHLGCYVYRYDIQKDYDTRTRAVTFYVTSRTDVRGAAHLEPRVLSQTRVAG
ncbi:MAG TPA: ABC transporter ATP-binding protein [Polyangia bacterium]|jgi:lipopolysaccharide transport system ATP-binding protein|nr:ABC transporter ATP-binding protein [Polyangia bacterium]